MHYLLLRPGSLLVPLLVFVIAGCASIVDGRRQAMTFNSVPEGAHVVVNGVTSGVTPTNIVVERSVFSDTVVVIKKNGYSDMEIKLAKSTNWWFLGNLLSGGLIGTTTDTVSGAIVQYQLDQYQVTLTPLKMSQVEADELRQETELRSFILHMYGNLGEDISRGDGEALNSLYTLLNVSEDSQRQTALEKIGDHWTSLRHPPNFAEAVIASFKHKTTADKG